MATGNDNDSIISKSYTSISNESTVALIPKPKPPTTNAALNDSQSTSTASATRATNATSSTGKAPVTKDWESAYGQLASSMGFSGGAPRLPPKKPKKNKQADKKPGRGKDKSASSSSDSGAQTGGNAGK